MNKLYVGNLPYSVTEDELKNLFAKYGEIVSANVITDKYSGRSKGFGFVEFETEEQAKAAEELNGKDLEGRPLKVNIAREKQDRPGNGGGRGGHGGGRGGRW